MICHMLRSMYLNVRNRRTVKKYDMARNAKSIIKRLLNHEFVDKQSKIYS